MLHPGGIDAMTCQHDFEATKSCLEMSGENTAGYWSGAAGLMNFITGHQDAVPDPVQDISPQNVTQIWLIFQPAVTMPGWIW